MNELVKILLHSSNKWLTLFSEYKEFIFFSHLCLAYARKGDKQKTKEWAKKGLEAYEKYSGERVERIKENLEWYKSEDFPWKEFKEENEFEISPPEANAMISSIIFPVIYGTNASKMEEITAKADKIKMSLP